MVRDASLFGLAALAAVPAFLLIGFDTYYTIADYTDECIQWGADENNPQRVPTEGPCAGKAHSRSATKAEWLARFLIVEGVVLVGLTLGVVGLCLSRFWLAVAGGLVLLAVTLPLILGSSGFLTLASSLMILGFAYWTRSRVRIPPPPPPPPPAAKRAPTGRRG